MVLPTGAITGLFLALAAIQFVVMGETPASSYTTALQQLVLLSYVCLILVGLENVIICRFPHFLWLPLLLLLIFVS